MQRAHPLPYPTLHRCGAPARTSSSQHWDNRSNARPHLCRGSHNRRPLRRVWDCNSAREAVVGYVTRGKGVAVHSIDCPNVVNLMYEPERRIDVEWGKEEGAPSAFP